MKFLQPILRLSALALLMVLAAHAETLKLAPDLLTMQNGTPVTATSWPERRQELAQLLIPHQFGGMPPAPIKTEIFRRAQSRPRDMTNTTYRVYEVLVTLAPGKSLSLSLTLWIPKSTQPLPVLLDGDGCWRYFQNPEIIRATLARGNIAASIDRTEAAADNPDIYRQTGLYRLYPEAHYSVLPIWAWALHRAVDALLMIPEVRQDAIAITGHSRGGKTVLLAGATDPRIALTNPNCSGIGGASLHRRKARGSEVIASFFRSRNIFWFSEEFSTFKDRDAQLPYDQHFLHAMVAPRLLLVTDGREDLAANPPGAYAACRAAQAVYELLGQPQAIGWVTREGGHTHSLADYLTLLDFMDRHFHHRTVTRDFQAVSYPDLSSCFP